MTNDKAIWERGGLAEYWADEKATDCLAYAGTTNHPDAAKDALLIAADYIRRGEALPGNLAQYLAEAIELAMAKPEKLRAKALTDELYLTANNRRPTDDWARIGGEVERLIKEGYTQENAFAYIEKHFRVPYETVKGYWKKYRPAMQEFHADMQQRITERNHNKG